ncbi:MAG: hypothetical protein ACRC8S_21465 [Fimbriiglobus sp.]
MIRHCRDAVELMSRELDGELRWLDRADAKIHRVLCAKCRSYFAQISVVHQVLEETPTLTEESLKPESRAKIDKRLGQEIRGSG